MCTVAQVCVVARVPDRTHAWLHARKHVVLPRVCVCARFAHARVVAGALCAWLHECAGAQMPSCSQLHGCAGFHTCSVAPTCVVSHVRSCVLAQAGACVGAPPYRCTCVHACTHTPLHASRVCMVSHVQCCTCLCGFTLARLHKCTVAHARVFARTVLCTQSCTRAQLHAGLQACRVARTCVHACSLARVHSCKHAPLHICTRWCLHECARLHVHVPRPPPCPPLSLPPAFCSSRRQRLREEPPDLRPRALRPPSGWLHLPLPPRLLAQHPGHPLHR